MSILKVIGTIAKGIETFNNNVADMTGKLMSRVVNFSYINEKGQKIYKAEQFTGANESEIRQKAKDKYGNNIRISK